MSVMVTLPPAAVSGFGRWQMAYEFFAHAFALAPGIIGDYLRIAFYKLTLGECSLSSRVSFGSFFPHADARLGPEVYVPLSPAGVRGSAYFSLSLAGVDTAAAAAPAVKATGHRADGSGGRKRHAEKWRAPIAQRDEPA
jgi:hypothetical protein